MRSIALLLGFGFTVPVGLAQQVWVYGPANTKPAVPAPGAATNATAPGKPVVVYHQIDSGSYRVSNSKAEELVELRGVRKRFEYDESAIVATEKRNILHDFPSLNPNFVDEWARRVSAKMNADDYVATAARVYASHFTDDELAKLVEGVKNINSGKPSGLAPSLIEKWTHLLPTMSGETEGEYAQEGAKLSTEVA